MLKEIVKFEKYFFPGIRVRSRKTDYLMHHKFVIVDNKLLVNGSANWTIQAFFGNYENVLITNESELVSLYKNEFEKLWLEFGSELKTEETKKFWLGSDSKF